jgi:hydrogenase nickel incorporation protein HypA/HybF
MLSVGVLSGVSVDALRFAFDAFKASGDFDCGEMVLTTVLADGRCRECGVRFAVDSCFPTCASCGSIDVEVSGGAEFMMSELEGE